MKPKEKLSLVDWPANFPTTWIAFLVWFSTSIRLACGDSQFTAFQEDMYFFLPWRVHDKDIISPCWTFRRLMIWWFWYIPYIPCPKEYKCSIDCTKQGRTSLKETGTRPTYSTHIFCKVLRSCDRRTSLSLLVRSRQRPCWSVYWSELPFKVVLQCWRTFARCSTLSFMNWT